MDSETTGGGLAGRDQLRTTEGGAGARLDGGSVGTLRQGGGIHDDACGVVVVRSKSVQEHGLRYAKSTEGVAVIAEQRLRSRLEFGLQR
ncbi:AMP-binding domain-containing protein [Psidium guajava]|nr:AMP-binding domain-containing protein [Psidium guajava]